MKIGNRNSECANACTNIIEDSLIASVDHLTRHFITKFTSCSVRQETSGELIDFVEYFRVKVFYSGVSNKIIQIVSKNRNNLCFTNINGDLSMIRDGLGKCLLKFGELIDFVESSRVKVFYFGVSNKIIQIVCKNRSNLCFRNINGDLSITRDGLGKCLLTSVNTHWSDNWHS